MRTEVNGELAGVTAGVRADLAFERALVVMDPKVLLQTAAVRRSIGAVLALVRPLASVRAAVHVKFVTPAEALVAELTFKWLLTCSREGKTKRGQMYSHSLLK